MNGRQKDTSQAVEDLTVIFPRDTILHILSYLRDKELHSAKSVSKRWKELADTAHYRQTFQNIKSLEGSEVWRYLSSIAEDENIIEFYKKNFLLDEDKEITSNKTEWHKLDRCALSDLCFSLGNKPFLTHHYGQKLKFDYLQSRAQFILKTISPDQKTLDEIVWKNFWKYTPENEQKQNEVFLAYKKIEGIIAILRVILYLSPAVDPNGRYNIPAEKAADMIIANPSICQSLTSEGLVLINTYYVEMIPYLMDLATDSAFSQDEISKQEKIAAQEMLRKISLADWLDYLTARRAYHISYNANLVKKAIEDGIANKIIEFSPVTQEKLLQLAAIRFQDGINPALDFILRCDNLTQQLKDDRLVELITNLSAEYFSEFIKLNPHFLQKLNLKLVDKLVEKELDSLLIILLNREESLNEISWEKIKKIQESMTGNFFASFIESSAFKKKLNQIPDQEKKSQIITSIAKSDRENRYVAVIAGIAELANLLDVEYIIEIAKTNGRIGERLIIQPGVAAKLTDAQLGELARNNLFIGRAVFLRYPRRLGKEDLQISITNFKGWLDKDVSKKIEGEIKRKTKKEKSVLKEHTIFNSVQNLISKLPKVSLGGLFHLHAQPVTNQLSNNVILELDTDSESQTQQASEESGKAKEEDIYTLTPTLSRNNAHHT